MSSWSAVVRSYRKDFWRHQPTWLKVFSEKSTVGGVVRPVLDEFGIGFQVMHGFGSATACIMLRPKAEAVAAAISKSFTLAISILPGCTCPKSTSPGRVREFGGALRVTRCALLRDDCSGLPSSTPKRNKDDPRYRWFVEHYGDTCWELDAMDPNSLRQRLRDEIERRIDQEAWEHCKKVEEAKIESIERYVSQWPEQIGS